MLRSSCTDPYLLFSTLAWLGIKHSPPAAWHSLLVQGGGGGGGLGDGVGGGLGAGVGGRLSGSQQWQSRRRLQYLPVSLWAGGGTSQGRTHSPRQVESEHRGTQHRHLGLSVVRRAVGDMCCCSDEKIPPLAPHSSRDATWSDGGVCPHSAHKLSNHDKMCKLLICDISRNASVGLQRYEIGRIGLYQV